MKHSERQQRIRGIHSVSLTKVTLLTSYNILTYIYFLSFVPFPLFTFFKDTLYNSKIKHTSDFHKTSRRIK